MVVEACDLLICCATCVDQMREEMEEAMLHQIEEAVGDLQKRLDVRA
jgi:hypothetical protein